MAIKFIYISNDEKQNYYFCSFKLLVEKFEHLKIELTNQDLKEVPKVFKANQ